VTCRADLLEAIRDGRARSLAAQLRLLLLLLLKLSEQQGRLRCQVPEQPRTITNYRQYSARINCLRLQQYLVCLSLSRTLHLALQLVARNGQCNSGGSIMLLLLPNAR